MKVHRGLPVLFCLSMLLAACGGTTANTQPKATATIAATATPKVAHAGQTVDQILSGLKAKGLPIGASFTYNASNDENHLLGRPNQYIGKVNFVDTRIPASGNTGADTDVSDGGSIELCANPQDAQSRLAYIHSISSSSALFAEYEYVDGNVVLRLSKVLTPDQAQAYLTALKQLP